MDWRENSSWANETAAGSGWSGVVRAGGNASGGAEQAWKEQLAVIQYALSSVATLVVCVLGLVGNLLSVTVLVAQRSGTSTNCYLVGLSLCDSLMQLFTLTLIAVDIHNVPGRPTNDPTKSLVDRFFPTNPTYSRLFPVLHPLINVFQVLSVWLTVMFAADRWLMICLPLHARRWCNARQAKIALAGAYVAAALYGLPRFFEYQTVEIQPLGHFRIMDKVLVHSLTTIGMSHQFRTAVHLVGYFLFQGGLPFVVLLLLNTLLLVELKKSRDRLQHVLNTKTERRLDTDVMLIGVIVIFLICQLPALVSRIVWAIDMNAAIAEPAYSVLNEVANFLIVVNSSINIVPYYAFSRRFRRTFKHLYWYRCRNDADDNSFGTMHPVGRRATDHCTVSPPRLHAHTLDVPQSTRALSVQLVARSVSHSNS